MIERFLGWPGDTPWSVALLESLCARSLAESAHVLTLGLFTGAATRRRPRSFGGR